MSFTQQKAERKVHREAKNEADTTARCRRAKQCHDEVWSFDVLRGQAQLSARKAQEAGLDADHYESEDGADAKGEIRV